MYSTRLYAASILFVVLAGLFAGLGTPRTKVNVCDNNPGPDQGKIIVVYKSEAQHYAPIDDPVCA